MSLPIYQNINIKLENYVEAKKIFVPNMNLKHPIAFNLLTLNEEMQKEFLDYATLFFQEYNISFKFPYPIYFISSVSCDDYELLMLKKMDRLPKFFSQKESKLNVKETHLMGKNKLLQQEAMNVDTHISRKEIASFTENHQRIAHLEDERLFYKSILNKMIKAQKNG